MIPVTGTRRLTVHRNGPAGPWWSLSRWTGWKWEGLNSGAGAGTLGSAHRLQVVHEDGTTTEEELAPTPADSTPWWLLPCPTRPVGA